MNYLSLWGLLAVLNGIEAKSKCYSCATSNMKQNFLTKQRGPPNRKSEPLTYDNYCNSDTWIIKDRSTDECDGPCFKWTQSLNNSGSYSTMTFRGCYEKLYNLMDPTTIRPPDHSFCTVGEVPLTCLSDASIIEHSCWCEGDYCNSAALSLSLISFIISFIVVY